MKAALLILLLAPTLAWNQDSEPATNVNSRYTVESIEIPAKIEHKLSTTLRDEITKLVGEKFNQETLDKLTRKIRREMGSYKVSQKTIRGSQPEHLKVVFEFERRRGQTDLVVPRLVYHSKQNFSFGADGTFDIEGNLLSFGILTDNDEILERYSGIRAGFHRTAMGDRIKVGVAAESWRAQWDPATLEALARRTTDVSGIYRERLHIEPTATFRLAEPLTLTIGVSIQRVETQFPAAHNEFSNAFITSLRLERRFEDSALGVHRVEAGYSLRAATNSLDSDFVYTRHAVNGRYEFSRSHETVIASFTAGTLGGRAPLFERFVLGNSTTLRGYNKYDIAPLGGNRMAHGSLEYRHRFFRIFYDAGSVWDDGREAKVRHSIAAGFTTGSPTAFSMVVAFPIKQGRAEPIFILGMNF